MATEKWLIDANKLERKIVEMTREPNYQHTGEDWLNGLAMAMEAVNEAPTVDAVEVVRCKNCKHLYCCSAVDREFYCRHPKGLKGRPNIVEENPFCPYGERSKEE